MIVLVALLLAAGAELIHQYAADVFRAGRSDQ